MLLTIGNSHAHFFTGQAPGESFGKHPTKNIISYSIGPVVAYNFYEHHHIKCTEILKLYPPESELSVMLVVGEVDCRWHIPRQAELQNKSTLEITRECVARFFRSILQIKEAGYNVIGWGGHPSTVDGHNDNPSCPVYGDCGFRNNISKEWNSLIGEACKEHSIPFISIIDHLIDENNLTKMEYFIDYCHLNTFKLENVVYKLLHAQGCII